MLDEKIKKALDEAEMVLIGIGDEFAKTDDEQEDQKIISAYNELSGLVKGKTYFILSENKDTLIFRSRLLSFFICEPFGPEDKQECTEEQWNTYMRWLSGTLGHKLCILELGVGFTAPQLIRWPFEKTAQFNLKSTFIRVHKSFPQLSEEAARTGRAISVKEDAVTWLSEAGENG